MPVKSGSVTANNAVAVAVADTAITANSVVILQLKTANGAQAGLAVVTLNAGVGFSIASGAADTSVYTYVILAY